MLTLTYDKHPIASIPDPDPAVIQAAIESHLGLTLDNPVTSARIDSDGWAILQWDPTCKNYRQIGSLRPEEDGL